MNKKQRQGQAAQTWKRYSHKGYSTFASLGRQIRIGVLSAATLTTLSPMHAQTDSLTMQAVDTPHATLQEVQVSATMAPMPQQQAARLLTVISRDDIQRAGVQSINDLLKTLPGIDLRQRGSFGIQTDIAIDGGTFDQALILLNGVNLSDPQIGHYSANLPISLSDIERIEILQGSGSRIHGPSALGGCINIITRRDTAPSAFADIAGGQHGTFQSEARLALTRGRLSNRISGGGGRSDGGTQNSDWRKGQLYYQGNLRADRIDLDWQYGFLSKSYGANTFYSAAYPDQHDFNQRHLLSVSASTHTRFRFTPQVYWNRTLDNFQLVRGTTFGENHHTTDTYGMRLGGHLPWRGGTTAVSTEIRSEGILSTNLGLPLDPAEYVGVRKKNVSYDHRDQRTNVSYNLEHNLAFRRWTLSAGVIANMNTSVGHGFRFYPGIDAAYHPTARLKLSASYSKGFRLPTFTDLYYQSPTHSGNVGLKPEDNHSMQLAARYAQSGIAATLRGFYHRGRNMIDWVMYSAEDKYHSATFNLDNMGLQADVRADFPALLRRRTWVTHLSAGYTYMHQRRRDHTYIYKSNYALEYLRHKLTATLEHRIVSRLSATWALRWQDRMGAYIAYGPAHVDPDSGRLTASSTGELVPYRPYCTLDLKLQWTDRRYQLYLQGTNITNRRYYDLGNIPQPGIWVMGGARLSLRL